MSRILIALGVFQVVVLVPLLYWSQFWHADSENAVRQWLDAAHQGDSDQSFWPGEPHLYAVQSYEILRSDKSHCRVRIHSATDEGMPIVNIYEITIQDGRITAVDRKPAIAK